MISGEANIAWLQGIARGLGPEQGGIKMAMTDAVVPDLLDQVLERVRTPPQTYCSMRPRSNGSATHGSGEVFALG